MMCYYKYIIDISTLIISIITVIILFRGLHTWKEQIRGENKFNLAWNVLKEIKLLMNNINEYRLNLIYTNYDLIIQNGKINIGSDNTDFDINEAFRKLDNERFISILKQFNKCESKLSELMILENKGDLDYLNGKRLRDFIFTLHKSYFVINEINSELKINPLILQKLKPDDKKLYEESKRVLHKIEDEDKWGSELNKYIDELNIKLREYLI